MKYLPVVVLAIAVWLVLSAACAGLLSPVARGLKRSRAEERRVALSVEDRTPDDLMDVAQAVGHGPARCPNQPPCPHTAADHVQGPVINPEVVESPMCLVMQCTCGESAPAETYGQERLYAPQCRAAYPYGMADWVCTLPPHSSTTMHGDGPIRWDADGDVYAATEATS